MKLYIVRHGRTKNNELGVFHGRLDTPLDNTGRAQAASVAQFLANIEFEAAYSSTLCRSIETLDIILGKRIIPRVCDSRLDERSLGVFEGLTYSEVKQKYSTQAQSWMDNWLSFTPPEGESYDEVRSRVSSFLDDIVQSGRENILVVTHAGIMRTFYALACQDNAMYWKFGCRNCDIALISLSKDGFYTIDYIRPLNG